ncbi:MAG: hypothetical protein AAFQ35_12460 [Pseudomonadota bacterium]
MEKKPVAPAAGVARSAPTQETATIVAEVAPTSAVRAAREMPREDPSPSRTAVADEKEDTARALIALSNRRPADVTVVVGTHQKPAPVEEAGLLDEDTAGSAVPVAFGPPIARQLRDGETSDLTPDPASAPARRTAALGATGRSDVMEADAVPKIELAATASGNAFVDDGMPPLPARPDATRRDIKERLAAAMVSDDGGAAQRRARASPTGARSARTRPTQTARRPRATQAKPKAWKENRTAIFSRQ